MGLDDDEDGDVEIFEEKSFSVVDESVNEDEDADDLEMIKALEKHNNTINFKASTTATSKNGQVNAAEEYVEPTEALTLGLNEDQLLSTQYFDTSGFDSVAGSVWIYPNNMPTRSYQYEIVHQCLHKNTMVVLPTGMGKTFIAVSLLLLFLCF